MVYCSQMVKNQHKYKLLNDLFNDEEIIKTIIFILLLMTSLKNKAFYLL